MGLRTPVRGGCARRREGGGFPDFFPHMLDVLRWFWYNRRRCSIFCLERMVLPVSEVFSPAPRTPQKPKRALSGPALGGAGLLSGALLLAVLAVAAPGSGLFFPLASLWADLALFAAAAWVLRVAGVRLQWFHWGVLGGIWAGAVLYSALALSRREFVYFWDYANYILKQYEMEAAFSVSAAEGFRLMLSSITDDYTRFISLFTEFPFCFTDHSGDSYAFSMTVSVFPSLLVLLAGVVCKVGQMLRVERQRLFFLIGLSWTVTYPFLRMAAMLAQPDWFGLIFAFMIFLLTLDHRFDRLEPARCGLLFFATASIILTRRWYLYFVVGYYFAYVLLLIASSARLLHRGNRGAVLHRARNVLLYGIGAVVCMVGLLWPLVRHILLYNYASRYSYYNTGGFTLELRYQFLRVGLLNVLLILLGLWFAVRRRLPALPCLAGCELLTSLVLFTRVQNTGSHQMLMLVPGWLLLFLVGAAALAENFSRRRVLKAGFWGFTVLFALSVRCSPLTIVALPEPVMQLLCGNEEIAEFVRLDTLLYDRADLSQLKALTDWVEENCTEGETAFCIPHDMLYNADTFQNCTLPQRRAEGKLASGFSIPGTQAFPTAYLTSKYVFTAEPFPLTYVNDGDLSSRMNTLFLAEREERFAYETAFDMGNGTVFTVWRRVVPADWEEAERCLAWFADVDAQYPELFREVIRSWEAQNGLTPAASS